MLNPKMPTQPSLREVSERRPVMQQATPPHPQFHRPGQGPSDPSVASASGDIGQLLAPVRAGLQRVEVKMKAVDSAIFAPLASAFLDLIGSGGKRLRPALALMAAEFNGSLQGKPDYEKVIALAASVEMLHTSTLVHDDVIDGALLRRGSPTLNAAWSGGSTVLAGNYMFGSAARFSAETQNIRVIHKFSETIKIIVDGELRQLLDRNNYHQEKDAYYQRIYAKTASLFCAATEGAAILSDLPDPLIAQLRDYGYNFGMAFQIMDDILDFTGDESSLGKPAGSDLRQGTLTLPFFYFLRDHAAPEALIATLEEKFSQAEMGEPQIWQQMVAQLVGEVCASDAIEAARKEAKVFLNYAQASLAPLPDNIYKQSMLGLCDFVVQRTY
ncbi:MAG: polyprenyl synthetase family protein [Chloroflexi bacterium]|nr:polyprenyl synthetase family protein [Chloroflexota bacterium]